MFLYYSVTFVRENVRIKDRQKRKGGCSINSWGPKMAKKEHPISLEQQKELLKGCRGCPTMVVGSAVFKQKGAGGLNPHFVAMIKCGAVDNGETFVRPIPCTVPHAKCKRYAHDVAKHAREKERAEKSREPRPEGIERRKKSRPPQAERKAVHQKVRHSRPHSVA